MAERGEKRHDPGDDRKSSCAMELETLGVTEKQPHKRQRLEALNEALEAKVTAALYKANMLLCLGIACHDATALLSRLVKNNAPQGRPFRTERCVTANSLADK